jgi:hypothetical protein
MRMASVAQTQTEDLNNLSYIYLYKMGKSTVLHSPTLESVLMVEKTIQKYSQECGKYQLWKRLPKKMIYQTFQVILDYLEQSGKIMIDKDGCVLWTYDPEGIRKLLAKGVTLR